MGYPNADDVIDYVTGGLRTRLSIVMSIVLSGLNKLKRE